MSRKSKKHHRYHYPGGRPPEADTDPDLTDLTDAEVADPAESDESVNQFELDEVVSPDTAIDSEAATKPPVPELPPVEIQVQGDRKFCEFTISDADEEKRLDIFLAERFSEFSRVRLRKTISQGNVSVNGEVVKPSFRLYAGQQLVFDIVPELYKTDQHAENIPLDVLYEDESMIAINKPAGMVVHPAKGHWRGTLTSGLLYRFKQLSSVGGANRPGIVHRLDRETSGVILVAKTDQAHMSLSQQFQERTVEKQYFAIVSPAPNFDQDIVDQPIGKHPFQRERMAVRENHETSRPAQTIFKVLERFHGFAAINAFPKTGRTHQIRVHMAHVGCPILCDRIYSGRASISEGMLEGKSEQVAGWDSDAILNRQALHAQRIQFAHPVSGKRMSIEAPLADDIQQTVEALRRLRPKK